MPSAEQLKAEGNAAFAAGRNEEALRCYLAALDAAAASGDTSQLHVLHSNAAAAALRLGQAHKALEHASRSVELQPGWMKGWVRKAAACLALHRPGQAEAALKEGLKHLPDDPALTLELKKLQEEDGDQRPLRGHLPGTPAQNMRDFQGAQGMDLGPHELAAFPCDAFRCAFMGDVEGFRASFRPAEHMRLRALELRLPLPAVIVAGAQRISSPGGGPTGHAAILRLVCEAGCRVEARDVAGYTALAHCCGQVPQLELAGRLVKHGADPSAKDRFGTSPLFHAIMSQEDEVARWLLEHGADAGAVDNENVSVETIARLNPALLALIHQKLGRHQQNAGLQTGAPCFNCGAPGATRRCGECRTAMYCSRTCQRSHWKTHKKECGGGAAATSAGGGGGSSGAGASLGSASPAGHLRLKASRPDSFMSLIPRQDLAATLASSIGASSRPPPALDAGSVGILGPEEQEAAAGRRNSKTFIMKVQVPLVVPPGVPASMLIYNESRSFQAGGARPAAGLPGPEGLLPRLLRCGHKRAGGGQRRHGAHAALVTGLPPAAQPCSPGECHEQHRHAALVTGLPPAAQARSTRGAHTALVTGSPVPCGACLVNLPEFGSP